MHFRRKLFTGPAIALCSVGLFGKWRSVLCVCPYKLSPLDDTMTLATRSGWTLKPGAFCLCCRVCYQPRTQAGFANLSVNRGQVSPKCRLRFEQNGLSSRWQGGIYDLGWKPSEHLTCNQADLGCSCAWRACVYLKQNLRPRFREYEPAWAKTRRGLHDPAVNCSKKVSRDFIAHPGWVQAQTQKQYPDVVSGSPASLLTRCHCGW